VLTGTLLMLSRLAGRPGPKPTREGRRAYGLGALADPGLRTLVFASLPVGFALGSIEVAVPAFSEAEGSKALAGVLLAVWSIGSGIAGLAWGAQAMRFRLLAAHLRFAWLLPLAIAPLALASSPLTMGVLVLLAGLPIAPLIASRNQLVERVTPRGTATEAYTWPLTALVGGVSLGAAVAGAVVESSSWTTAVVVAAGVAALGATIVSTRRHTLGLPQPA
jgi:MFS family permease